MPKEIIRTTRCGDWQDRVGKQKQEKGTDDKTELRRAGPSVNAFGKGEKAENGSTRGVAQ